MEDRNYDECRPGNHCNILRVTPVSSFSPARLRVAFLVRVCDLQILAADSSGPSFTGGNGCPSGPGVVAPPFALPKRAQRIPPPPSAKCSSSASICAEPGFRSCNMETAIVSEPSPQTEFFTITRKHSRSYLGDSRMYPTLAADQEPIELCPAFEKLRLPNIHTWDPAQGRYTDPEFTIRHQDPGKGGSPYGK